MTAPKTQIQALINKIDEVLQSKPSLNPSQQMNDAHQQQVLEQARNYLSSLQNGDNTLPADNVRSNVASSPSLPKLDASSPLTSIQQQQAGVTSIQNQSHAAPAESAQQVLQAVVQEMNYLRVNMMQPLREELTTLYQQRQLITADIQRLEQQRQDLLLSNQDLNQQQLIQTFMQSLTDRLQEELAAQIAQTYSNLELHASQLPNETLEGGNEQPRLSPGERLLYMQNLQSQSDEMLLRLDATLRVVFDSLQTNVEDYHESLIHGLEKLRGLGKQGEALMAALLNRFAEQIGRGAASHYLSSTRKEWELPGLGSVEGPDNGLLPRQPIQSEDQVTVPDKLPEEQLDRFINTLDDSLQSDSDTEESLSDSSDLDIDDSLIDELLGTLNAGQDLSNVAFDLDNVELSTNEGQSIEPVLNQQPDANVAPSSTDPLTLFEIEDDGVRVHLDSDRLNQLQDQDADSLLSDLDELTRERDARSTLSQDGDGSSVEDQVSESLQSAVDEDDEALAFLDQIATEVEDDLSIISTEYEAQGVSNTPIPEDELSDAIVAELLDVQQSGIDHDTSDELDNQQDVAINVESDERSDRASDGEVDTFLSMFEPASSSSKDSDRADNSPENAHVSLVNDAVVEEGDSSDRPSLDPNTNTKADDQSSVSEEFTSTLSHLFEDLEDGDDESTMGAFASETVEVLIDDDDLLADLGIATQQPIGGAKKQDNSSSERIETITSLAQLIDDDESRAVVESASDLNMLKASENPFQLDDAPSEGYVIASSEEDLLVSDGPEKKVSLDVSLDDDQRQRLAIDLANVEGLDTSEVLSSLSLEFREPSNNETDDIDASLSSRTIEGFLPPSDDFFMVDDASSTVDDMSTNPAETNLAFASPSTGEKVSEEATGENPIPDSSPGALTAPELNDDTDNNPTLDDLTEAISNASSAKPVSDQPNESNSSSDSLSGMMQDLFGENEGSEDTSEPESGANETHAAEDIHIEADDGQAENTRTEGNASVLPAKTPEESKDNGMTLSSLFSSGKAGTLEHNKKLASDADLFSVLEEAEQFEDDAEIQGIFEELQSLGDDLDIEAPQAQQEQTLMELKGVSQPSIPDDDLPSKPSDNQTAYTWTVFDDLEDHNKTAESDKPES
ncbi:MAG: hypothetical protein AAFR31_16365 [Cyanobacteria bacterium J06627_8]